MPNNENAIKWCEYAILWEFEVFEDCENCIAMEQSGYISEWQNLLLTLTSITAEWADCCEFFLDRRKESFMTNEQYYDLIVPYQDALNLLKARLDVLNHSMYGNKSHPIHNIQFRIKQKASIEEKLKRMDLQGSFMNAKEHLQDIAGIRVICYFEKDVELLAEQLRKQSDLILVKEKDYITNPKPNGYRSFHMILGIQVYSMESTEYYPVEVQIRTIGMDFWASMEHRICYKQERDNKEEIQRELLRYAEILKEIEEGFEGYNEQNQNEKARLSHKTN